MLFVNIKFSKVINIIFTLKTHCLVTSCLSGKDNSVMSYRAVLS